MVLTITALISALAAFTLYGVAIAAANRSRFNLAWRFFWAGQTLAIGALVLALAGMR
jgi:hypothetical protein